MLQLIKGYTMILSPLQLKHYQFLDLSVSSNPKADLAKSKESKSYYVDFDDVDVLTDVNSRPGSKNKNRAKYFVSLAVTSSHGENSNFPYDFKAAVFGAFEIELTDQIKDPERLAVVNGVSMLYGIVRDQFLSMTARFVSGPMLLPTLDFRSFDKTKNNEKSKEASKKVPSKKTRKSKESQA